MNCQEDRNNRGGPQYTSEEGAYISHKEERLGTPRRWRANSHRIVQRLLEEHLGSHTFKATLQGYLLVLTTLCRRSMTVRRKKAVIC